jgi:hypothetical protein
MLNQAFIQDDFNPEDIPFRTLPTMSDTVFQIMLSDKEGKLFPANLHEGIFVTYFTYFVHCIFCILMNGFICIQRGMVISP